MIEVLEKAMNRTVATLGLVLLSSALASGPLRAQEALARETFTETVDVELVNVDVIVENQDGHPIHGLTKGDFQIFEDGKEVEVTHFFAVDAGQGRSENAADNFVPETQRLRLILFVDSLHIQPRTRNRLFDDLRTLLDKLRDDDQIMIVEFNGHLKVELKLTNDRAAIEETLDRLGKGAPLEVGFLAEQSNLMREIRNTRLSPAGGRDGEVSLIEARSQLIAVRQLVERDRSRAMASIRTLETFATSLAGLPGRKAVLYLSDGLPSRPAAAAVRTWREKYEGWILDQGVTELRSEVFSLENLEADLTPELRRMAESASAQNVAFYPIADTGRNSLARASAELQGSGAGPTFSPELQAGESMSREGSLQVMANVTGGRAQSRSLNLGPLFEQLVDDFSSFYSLGYRKTRKDHDFHKIVVKVRGGGDWAVRHPQRVRESERMERLENKALSGVFYDFAENPLGVRVSIDSHQETVEGDYRVPVQIKFPLERLALLPAEALRQGRILLVIAAIDEKHNLSALKRILVPIQIAESAWNDKAFAAHEIDLVMRPGKNRLAIGARDDVSGLESTLTFDLNVGAGLRQSSGRIESPELPP